MGGVPFLPEEFAGPQEHTGAHFPADDIGPLVHEDGQVATPLHPARKGGADDRFRCGAYKQRLFQPCFWVWDERTTLRQHAMHGYRTHLVSKALTKDRDGGF